MTFSLTILGSSSALPTSKRFPSAHLLNVNERFFLIDCGEGTQIQLRKYKIGFGKLNHIFISHNHGDHVFGLFGLLASFQLLGRKSDLHIYGPENIRALIHFYKKNYMAEGDYKIIFNVVGHRRFQCIYEDRSLEVFAFPLKHRTPTTGFLFREKEAELNLKKEAIKEFRPGIEEMVKIKKGEDLVLENGKIIPNQVLTLPPWKPRAYAYVSDTAINKKIADYIREVDLLYHEATFEAKDADLARQTFHSTSVEAAEIARVAGVNKLLLGHFSTRYKKTDTILKEARKLFENSFVVEDGDKYVVDREREETRPSFE
ncbi:MAG: ribonuclease Z [Bacteroidota bacterium]